MMPQLYDMGIELTRQRALSAMPDAPVVPDTRTNPRLRRATARVLRRMAERIEPMT
jgi:hypothetical protein